ncbi:hypothetical protein TNCV_1698461 [Trichonephila clavipes]|nr:hypothetical protein TNCV_1698461 [Trichonephila clavipes]
MQIWKNRANKIDFVLKWLNRVGSEVGLTKGELEPWESFFRVHNVDIVKPFYELMRSGKTERGEKRKRSKETRAGRFRKAEKEESLSFG